MKKIKLFASLLLCTAAFAGCVGSTPQVSVSPVSGVPVTNTVYAVSPALATNSAAVEQAAALASGIAALVPQSAPVAPFITPAVTGILGLIALASAALAAYKNQQAATATASATTHANAAAALASAIVSPSPSATAAMSAAALNGSTAAVAVHLASAASPV